MALDASLHMPAADDPPVIVMAQGFGAERTFGTGGFIDAFTAAGYAVFTFDYRGFGKSAGKPRQLVHPKHHCEDWYNAVQYVRSLHVIDNQRVVLWGSSFAGGHVLVTAAEIPGLTGVIAQVPFCSSRSVMKTTPFGKMLKSLGHGLLDLLCALAGKDHRIALVAEPGEEFAMMDWPGWKRDYLKIATESETWTNSMPARSIFAVSGYNPIDSADKIQCPVFVLSGKRDQGIARDDVLATVARIPRCRHLELDFDHFDLYPGFDKHEQAVTEQLKFLRECLPLK
jgi:pimeloyl-ACP methyl ester carboxylesterase